MKILLISPKSTVRPMDSAWKTHMAPPLSLLVLAAVTPEEHDIQLDDENVEKLSFNEDVDLVGITVKVDTVYRAREISMFYQKKGIPVVWGGIHPTMWPGQCEQLADSVVIGEAEEIWPELVKDAEGGNLKKTYKCIGVVDPAKIPIPRWELTRGKNYFFTNTLRIGRGCPWRCEFCYNSSKNIAAGYRMKPIENVIKEIESLHTNHVMFIDDNFIGNVPYAKRLLNRFKTMGLTWHAAVSADIGRHDDILDMMAETGCKSLFIGFETLNPANIKQSMKMQNKTIEYDETIRKIHTRGMMVNASLVFGLDNDDTSVFPKTLDWLVRNKVETMTAHILTPYPGTQLYNRLVKEGRIIDSDLTHYNTAHVVFKPKLMSPDMLAKGYFKMYEQFYSFKNIFKRCPETKGQVIPYMQFNFLYRKYGKITSLLGLLFGMRNLARFATAISYFPRWKTWKHAYINTAKAVSHALLILRQKTHIGFTGK